MILKFKKGNEKIVAENIIGKYKGYNVHKINLKDYLGLTDQMRNDGDSIYGVIEDRYCFHKGLCIGRINENWTSIQLVNSNCMADYKAIYGSKIISERKTVESMAKVVNKIL